MADRAITATQEGRLRSKAPSFFPLSVTVSRSSAGRIVRRLTALPCRSQREFRRTLDN
jgi:hypothetical protein